MRVSVHRSNILRALFIRMGWAGLEDEPYNGFVRATSETSKLPVRRRQDTGIAEETFFDSTADISAFPARIFGDVKDFSCFLNKFCIFCT